MAANSGGVKCLSNSGIILERKVLWLVAKTTQGSLSEHWSLWDFISLLDIHLDSRWNMIL
jgi:DNA polymerase III gamma/tau subunit